MDSRWSIHMRFAFVQILKCFSKLMFAFSTSIALSREASDFWSLDEDELGKGKGKYCLEAERIWPHLNHYMSDSSSTFLFRQPTTSCTPKWFLHAFFETWVQQVTDSCTRLGQKREQWYVLKSLRNKPFLFFSRLNLPKCTKKNIALCCWCPCRFGRLSLLGWVQISRFHS